MLVVKNDHPDERAVIIPGEVVDAEGEPLDPQPPLTIAIEQTDPEVVSCVQDVDDQTRVTFHIGRSGNGTVRANISTPDGLIREVIEETFHVTTSDPAAIRGGKFQFETLGGETAAAN